MRVYIAGPMTGLPGFNYPAFRAAATQLTQVGFKVEDPSINKNPTPGDYRGWLRAGLAQLIWCDAVALLDGWEASGGARLEVNVAATLGMRVAPLAHYVSSGARELLDIHGVDAPKFLEALSQDPEPRDLKPGASKVIPWWQFKKRSSCPHSRLRGIYGDEIIVAGFKRLWCADCGKLLDGPVRLAQSRAGESGGSENG